MRAVRVLAGSVCLAIVACTHQTVGGSATTRVGVTKVNEPLPVVSGTALDGSKFDASSFRGHVLVLNVWATWCGPCRQEQPALEAVFRQYQARGVRFAGVNYRDDPAAARAWIAKYTVSYPSLSDPSGATAHTLKYPALPDTYVVDPSGMIRYLVFGATDERELSGLIDRVLAG